MKHTKIPILALLVCLIACGSETPRRVLIVGGIDNSTDQQGTHHGLSSAELYDEKKQAFVSTGSLNEGRGGHQATLLGNRQVLVTGGDGAETNHPVATAELYDPRKGSFRVTQSMQIARAGHTAVLLGNGQVLVAGGQDSTFTESSTAELFDPATGTFSPTGMMHEPRAGHTATLLQDGRVLVAGGGNRTSLLSSAELYDPRTGTFNPTGSMSIPRLFATATLLQDGTVLIAGGGSVVGNCTNCSVASAEIYDPTSGAFRPVGSMGSARRGHIAVLLKNHNVLVAGGLDDALPDPKRFLSSAEIFDTKNLAFVPISGMTTARFGHTASLLGNGKVLIAGGFASGSTITDTAELFDPLSNSFAVIGRLTDARAGHTSTGLSNTN